jgi:taurine dioxygenase
VDVRPLSPEIGAEIFGADLSRLDAATVATIRAALTRHGVVFFRDQPALAPDQQVAFARCFGDLHLHPAAPHLPGEPALFVIHAHRDSKIANGNGWHTDVSCDVEPPMATLLQLHVLPETGGDTLFASMYAALETLSLTLQNFLAALTATHESEHVYRGRYGDRGVDDGARIYPSAVHPLIRTHPESGRNALYVNPSFTTRINELSGEESRALLEFLFRHQQRPEFQIRFRWTENAIALWDNRCTQHFALWDYWPQERKGHRVTIQGEAPYYEPGRLVHRELRLARSLG